MTVSLRLCLFNVCKSAMSSAREINIVLTALRYSHQNCIICLLFHIWIHRKQNFWPWPRKALNPVRNSVFGKRESINNSLCVLVSSPSLGSALSVAILFDSFPFCSYYWVLLSLARLNRCKQGFWYKYPQICPMWLSCSLYLTAVLIYPFRS